MLCERGQAIVLLMLVLPVVLGIAVLAVDASKGYVQKRQMQTAADAAALAAAGDVKKNATQLSDPACTVGSACVVAIQSIVAARAGLYAMSNGAPGPNPLPPCTSPSQMNCYTFPYPSDAGPGTTSRGRVQVKLQVSVGTVFAKAAGIAANLLKPSALAVAGVRTTPGAHHPGMPGSNAVAYADSTACKGTGGAPSSAISYSGAGGGTIGAVATRGGIDVSGAGAAKIIDSIALGPYWQDADGTPHGDANCYQDPARITLTHPPVTHWTPTTWPVPLPAVPTPGAGCSPMSDPLATPVTTKALSGSTATLTTSANHGLNVGDDVLIALTPADPRFDGWRTLTTGTKNKTLNFAASGAPVSTSTAGTVTPTSQDVTMSGSGATPPVPAWALSHPPGIYCITGTTATLSLSNVDLSKGLGGATCAAGATNCGYTFFAPTFLVTSGTYRCYQYCNPLPNPSPVTPPLPTVMYASGPAGGIAVSGSGTSLTGYLFAPAGEIGFTGSGGAGGSGFMEAQTLKFAGNFNSYSGTGPGIGGTAPYDDPPTVDCCGLSE